jgi:TetR/AcrR family transcriptional repressor of nem operon
MGRTSNAQSRLIATAMALMYVRGYTAVGVHEISTQAGAYQGSFYHCFPSKQALVLAVIDTYGAHIRGLWEDVMTTEAPYVSACSACLRTRIVCTTSSSRAAASCMGVRLGTWRWSSGGRTPSYGRSCTPCLARGRG